MRVTCPQCGVQCRVLYVDENAREGIEVTYTCPNRRCDGYGAKVATRTLPRDEEKQGET